MKLEDKIFSALERIHTASRASLQKFAQGHGMSSLQAQILEHIATNRATSVSQLAEQLNVSKPTISDAVAALLEKKLVRKITEVNDARSYRLALTPAGRNAATEIAGYASPFLETAGHLKRERKQVVWDALLHLLKTMQEAGLIPPQRMCFTCKHFEAGKGRKGDYCKLMQSALSPDMLQIDCRDHAA